MSRVTLYYRFANEAAAIAALGQFQISSGGVDVWNKASIDAGVPIITSPAILDDLGNVTSPAVLSAYYHVNVLLQERDEALEKIGGWLGTLDTDTLGLIAGAHPTTPQRVFA